MEIIDAQMHLWDRDDPARPWDRNYGAADPAAAANRAHYVATQVRYEDAITAMDAVGVDAAVVVTPLIYGYDNSYSFDAVRRNPRRFGVVGLLDPEAGTIDERMRAWRQRPGALGIRIIAVAERDRAAMRGGHFDALLAAAARHSVPVCLFVPGLYEEISRVAEAHRDLSIVLDHFGLPLPSFRHGTAVHWDDLAPVLALARHPNIALKLTALPAFSALPFPYEDVWPHIHRALSVYGPRRLMWGSDWTRTASQSDYARAVAFMKGTRELSSADKEMLMSRTLRQIFRWPADVPGGA